MSRKTAADRPSKTNGRKNFASLVGRKADGIDVETDQALDGREEMLFRALDLDNDHQVLRSDLEQVLRQVGLSADDPRLQESMAALDAHHRAATAAREEEPEPGIPKDEFFRAIRHNILLIERALQGNLVIPDFDAFAREIDALFQETRKNRSGEPADYIPQLNLPEPAVDQFGLAVCSIDGQRHAAGDAEVFFPVESVCKPVSYCLALEEHGAETVHSFIGHEPSGGSFNELVLDKQNRPHNPMINAGAIMSCALIKHKEKRDKKMRYAFGDLEARGWSGARFDHVMETWQALCGGEKPRFSTPVYLSERATADRNFALGYYMREKNAFPAGAELEDVLDFYFQCCSIELNCQMMSLVAATLANGGICPVSGQRVFQPTTVQSCLSLMSSCGMYDFSGEFAFTIGLPAKSGVSGAIMIVVPNVLGICTWSPRLDEIGNSVRGLEFCRRLVETFNFHNYDNLTGLSEKKDPRVSQIQRQAVKVNELIWASSKGDLSAMRDQLLHGADLNSADYDLRTPLHLAAAENQPEVVKFFIEQQAAGLQSIDLNPRDRWGGTPLDDAHLHGNAEIIALLERAGGQRGKLGTAVSPGVCTGTNGLQADSHKIAELVLAASTGDLVTIRRLVAQGVPLDTADYDARTPLHLAAAEGHAEIVQYFVTQKLDVNPRDRWGNTPLDDALRHDRAAVADLLRRHGGRDGKTAAPKRPEKRQRVSA
ncbi:glutaminase A [Pelagibius sp.]|uniref:glutaminase A n=1 Tax=Pelagibius sp. TaxID=1931238 RepID=UPI002628FAD6|nr:glutaminase A [Pelagibius sp.]